MSNKTYEKQVRTAVKEKIEHHKRRSEINLEYAQGYQEILDSFPEKPSSEYLILIAELLECHR